MRVGIKAQVLRRLPYGSRLLQVPVWDRPHHHIVEQVTVREIRFRVARRGVPPLRVSFPNVLEVVKAMWFTLLVGDNLLTAAQTQQILGRMYAVMGTYVTPARRARACPRAVRQPVTKWPRLLHNASVEGPFRFTIG